MHRPALARLLALVALVAACTATGPASSPSPTPGVPLSAAALRFALIDQFGPLWYCDPDFYPVARDDEAAQAVKRFDEVRADAAVFATIAAHLGVNAEADVTADQKLALYRSWKQLNAIVLEPADGGRFRFDYLNAPAPGATEGRRTAGTIGADGAITIDQQAAAGEPNCPICLARATRIATPDGEIAIEDCPSRDGGLVDRRERAQVRRDGHQDRARRPWPRPTGSCGSCSGTAGSCARRPDTRWPTAASSRRSVRATPSTGRRS